MQQLDPRIVKVSIEVNGVLKTYDGLALYISGTKYANPLQNECEVKLFNLDRTTQDYIMTETSPYTLNKTPKSVIVEAGRVSYGTAKIYEGNIISSSLTQPPDIGVILKCLTGNFFKGSIISKSQPGQITLAEASRQIAQDMNLILNFQAKDKNLGNFSYSGSTLKQVDHLSSVGGVNAYIDDKALIVKDSFSRLTGFVKIVNAATGMIGIPEFTEQGIRVKFLLDNKTILGGGIRVESMLYPAANGDYVIYKLGFEIANRDTPFYYIAEASRR